MRAYLRLVIGAAVLAAPAVAGAAEVGWKLAKKDGRPYLFAMLAEPEGDTLFWVRCAAGGAIDVGIGGDADVGKGEGEPVTIALRSGNAAASVKGRSRRSGNFQMTGTHELRGRIDRGHGVFKVLSAGQPIAVSGAIKAMTWQVKGLKPMVAAFLKACQ